MSGNGSGSHTEYQPLTAFPLLGIDFHPGFHSQIPIPPIGDGNGMGMETVSGFGETPNVSRGISERRIDGTGPRGPSGAFADGGDRKGGR